MLAAAPSRQTRASRARPRGAKTRVGGFWIQHERRARRFAPQAANSHRVAGATAMKTASGPSQWLSRDPIQEWGGLNLYAMVLNAPINFIDPLGLLSVGGATSSAVQGVTVTGGATGVVSGGSMSGLGAAGLTPIGVGVGIGGTVAGYIPISQAAGQRPYSPFDPRNRPAPQMGPTPSPSSGSDPDYPMHGKSPGKDCEGRCLPCPPPPPPWEHTDHPHGPWQPHWHWYEVNQNPNDCKCWASRKSGPTPP
jgi:hypothetical protein